MVIMPHSSVLHDPLDISQFVSTPITSVGICGKFNYTTDLVIRQAKSHSAWQSSSADSQTHTPRERHAEYGYADE
jgi:hypothetical protein